MVKKKRKKSAIQIKYTLSVGEYWLSAKLNGIESVGLSYSQITFVLQCTAAAQDFAYC